LPQSALIATDAPRGGCFLGFNRWEWFICTILLFLSIAKEPPELGLSGFFELAHAVLVKKHFCLNSEDYASDVCFNTRFDSLRYF
jgi:hypothetical protein